MYHRSVGGFDNQQQTLQEITHNQQPTTDHRPYTINDNLITYTYHPFHENIKPVIEFWIAESMHSHYCIFAFSHTESINNTIQKVA